MSRKDYCITQNFVDQPNFDELYFSTGSSLTPDLTLTFTVPPQDGDRLFGKLRTGGDRSLPGTLIFLIAQLEQGASGNKHWQIYCEFSQYTTRTELKTIFGDFRIHIEERRGTALQAATYCTASKNEKPGETGSILAGPYCFGQWRGDRGKGARSDLSGLAEAINNGATVTEIARPDGAHFQDWLKYHGAITRAIALREEGTKRDRSRTWRGVTLLRGPPGTGKSTRAVGLAANRGETCFIYNREAQFNGYSGEKILCIDEFSGWIPFTDLLTILQPIDYKCR